MRFTRRAAFGMLFIGGLIGCGDGDTQVIVGALERERVALVSEAGEPIIGIHVVESQLVEMGTKILSQDTALFDAKLAQAQGARDRTAARLAELKRAPTRANRCSDRAAERSTKRSPNCSNGAATIDKSFRSRNGRAGPSRQGEA